MSLPVAACQREERRTCLGRNEPPPIPGICGVGAPAVRAKKAAAATERMFIVEEVEGYKACLKGYNKKRRQEKSDCAETAAEVSVVV